MRFCKINLRAQHHPQCFILPDLTQIHMEPANFHKLPIQTDDAMDLVLHHLALCVTCTTQKAQASTPSPRLKQFRCLNPHLDPVLWP